MLECFDRRVILLPDSQIPLDGGTDEGDSGPAAEIALTLDNIPLDLPIAGVGSRLLAGFIDNLLLLAILFAGGIAGGMLASLLKLRKGWFAAIVVVVMFLAQWVVWAVIEITTKGRTPGKAAVRLRVVTRYGGQPSAAAFLVRNLLRVVDYLVGVPMIAIDPLARRVGDHLAGTLVIHDRQPPGEPTSHRLPKGWGSREAAFVEAFVARSGEMQADRAAAMARRLLAAAERAEPGFCGGLEQTADPTSAVRRAFAVGGG
jgi:uncharacterized RDD family membrane protein YckC